MKAAAAKNVKAEKAVGAKDTERMIKAEAPREIPAAKAQISAAESRKEGEKHFAAEDKPAEKIPVKIEKMNLVPVAAEEKEPALQPLIPVAEEEPAADVIAFAGGMSELSAENTARLAAIADGFKRPGESKILIYAYNFNDGGNAVIKTSASKSSIPTTAASKTRWKFSNRRINGKSLKIF